jgi:DNA excision repair protein ERCC-2
MEDILFPHDKIREEQDKFVSDVYNVLTQSRNMLAHAPTGLGKSAAILSVAVPFALKNKLDIFFITPRHTQHKIVIDTLKLLMNKYGLNFQVTDFIGRRNTCLQSGVEDLSYGQFNEYCRAVREEETCEFYTNLRKDGRLAGKTKILLDRLEMKGALHVEEVAKEAREARLCPYEINLLKAEKSRIIIADYYHIFNPGIREAFFKKVKKELESSIIIVDEAHNLPSKVRDLVSDQLSSVLLDRAIVEARGYPIISILEGLREKLIKLAENVNEERLVNREEFIVGDEVIEELNVIADEVREIKKRSYIGGVASFLENWKGADLGFCRILKISEFGQVYLVYRCLDASIVCKEVVDKAYSVIGMSGTLMPLEMYRDLIGIDAELKYYKNPFPQENRLALIIPETSTKYTKRDPSMFNNIARKVAEIVNTVPGNTAVFFPSYKLRDNINVFLQQLCNKTTFLEYQGLGKEDREEILERFKSYKEKGAVLLGVAGGSFSEGIDLKGDYLKCVVVVGLPLARPDLETKALINYYDNKYSKGWDYGYVLPGMVKSVQSAGRCIRSEKDKGVVVFLDERYAFDMYMKCFPADWNLKMTKMPKERINEFFS